MQCYSLSHLADHVLLRDLAALLAQDRTTTAALLAHLAEVDERQLYRPAAYPSMFSYCVGQLHLSEEAAFKRIHAARTARRFPAIFVALADGRLHLSAVILLAPHLSEANADELLAAAAHRSKAELEQLLAERFPRPDLPTCVRAVAPASAVLDLEHAPGRVESGQVLTIEHAPGRVGPDGGEPAPAAGARPRVSPLAPGRFALEMTMGQAMHDKLRYAQALLGPAVRSGDVAQVLERGLDALIAGLERRKLAATSQPRASRRQGSANGRHIAAAVQRAVWERDQGQCTFVGEAGQRCPARERLEYDHQVPVARGGEATVENLRLRCRAHNQYEAERAFGSGFMKAKREESRCRAEEKREEARRRAEEKRAAAAERARAAAAAAAAEQDPDQSVVPWLRKLGFRIEQIRHAVAQCETPPGASLDDRMMATLRFLAPASARRVSYVPSTPA